MNKQKTLSNISTLEVGDVIIEKDGEERRIIGVTKEFITTFNLTIEIESNRNQAEINFSIKNFGWKLKEETNTTKEKPNPFKVKDENEKFFELYKEIVGSLMQNTFFKDESTIPLQAFNLTEACMQKLKEENKI